MYKNKSIGISVPAYNEENLILKTLESMPDYVDYIVVVNDGSQDKTEELIKKQIKKDKRIILISHDGNKGLGQALITGYSSLRDIGADIVSVMAGDNQMSADDLRKVIDPIAENKADYVKGNRLLHSDVYNRMPTYRFFGNSLLTLLTKFATGYWSSMDPQCGYTAISHKALSLIPIENMIKGYGYNAHILYMLNLSNLKVCDVEIEPVYGDEKSKIKLGPYIRNICSLLLGLTVKRLFKKHALNDFNPMVLFYFLSFLMLFLISAPMLFRLFFVFFSQGIVPSTTLIIFVFSFTNGLFSLFFAMWLDMEANKNLWIENMK